MFKERFLIFEQASPSHSESYSKKIESADIPDFPTQPQYEIVLTQELKKAENTIKVAQKTLKTTIGVVKNTLKSNGASYTEKPSTQKYTHINYYSVPGQHLQSREKIFDSSAYDRDLKDWNKKVALERLYNRSTEVLEKMSNLEKSQNLNVDEIESLVLEISALTASIEKWTSADYKINGNLSEYYSKEEIQHKELIKAKEELSEKEKEELKNKLSKEIIRAKKLNNKITAIWGDKKADTDHTFEKDSKARIEEYKDNDGKSLNDLSGELLLSIQTMENTKEGRKEEGQGMLDLDSETLKRFKKKNEEFERRFEEILINNKDEIAKLDLEDATLSSEETAEPERAEPEQVPEPEPEPEAEAEPQPAPEPEADVESSPKSPAEVKTEELKEEPEQMTEPVEEQAHSKESLPEEDQEETPAEETKSKESTTAQEAVNDEEQIEEDIKELPERSQRLLKSISSIFTSLNGEEDFDFTETVPAYDIAAYLTPASTGQTSGRTSERIETIKLNESDLSEKLIVPQNLKDKFAFTESNKGNTLYIKIGNDWYKTNYESYTELSSIKEKDGNLLLENKNGSLITFENNGSELKVEITTSESVHELAYQLQENKATIDGQPDLDLEKVAIPIQKRTPNYLLNEASTEEIAHMLSQHSASAVRKLGADFKKELENNPNYQIKDKIRAIRYLNEAGLITMFPEDFSRACPEDSGLLEAEDGIYLKETEIKILSLNSEFETDKSDEPIKYEAGYKQDGNTTRIYYAGKEYQFLKTSSGYDFIEENGETTSIELDENKNGTYKKSGEEKMVENGIILDESQQEKREEIARKRSIIEKAGLSITNDLGEGFAYVEIKNTDIKLYGLDEDFLSTLIAKEDPNEMKELVIAKFLEQELENPDFQMSESTYNALKENTPANSPIASQVEEFFTSQQEEIARLEREEKEKREEMRLNAKMEGAGIELGTNEYGEKYVEIDGEKYFDADYDEILLQGKKYTVSGFIKNGIERRPSANAFKSRLKDSSSSEGRRFQSTKESRERKQSQLNSKVSDLENKYNEVRDKNGLKISTNDVFKSMIKNLNLEPEKIPEAYRFFMEKWGEKINEDIDFYSNSTTELLTSLKSEDYSFKTRKDFANRLENQLDSLNIESIIANLDDQDLVQKFQDPSRLDEVENEIAEHEEEKQQEALQSKKENLWARVENLKISTLAKKIEKEKGWTNTFNKPMDVEIQSTNWYKDLKSKEEDLKDEIAALISNDPEQINEISSKIDEIEQSLNPNMESEEWKELAKTARKRTKATENLKDAGYKVEYDTKTGYAWKIDGKILNQDEMELVYKLARRTEYKEKLDSYFGKTSKAANDDFEFEMDEDGNVS